MRILTLSELDDRKPSALVNYMLLTLGDFGKEVLLQQIFLKKLPAHIQDALASTDLTDLESLGDRVDQIMAHPCRQTPSICSISSPADLGPDEDLDDSPNELHLPSRDHNAPTCLPSYQ